MDIANQKTHRYSAEVRMRLSVGGRVWSIAQLGPDFLILRAPVDHPPTGAEITMWIDDHERRWRVRLVDGISAEREKTPIARPD